MVEQKTIWLINQYASTPQTGMGGRHYYLAKELAKQGHTVYLIAASYTHLLRDPPKFSEKVKIESVEGFNFVWVKMPKYQEAHSKRRILNWFSFSWKLTYLDRFIPDRPDIVLYSSPSLIGFLGAQKLAKKYQARLAFEVRDIWPLTLMELGGYSAKHPFIRLMQWVEDRAYQQSNVVLSNLPNAVKHMEERGMSADKFHWVPNGFDVNELAHPMDLPEKILSLLPKNKFIVGYTGTLGLANALDNMIEAACLTRGDDSIAWVLVGEGGEKAALQEKCNKLKLNNTYFIDAIPKKLVQPMLGEFDVCFVTLQDSLLFKYGIASNKLFDYFASSKPVIYAVDSGDYLPVSDARAGESIKPNSPQKIIEAVKKIQKLSTVERQQLGCNGYEYAMKHHDYSKIAKKLFKVLCENKHETVD